MPNHPLIEIKKFKMKSRTKVANRTKTGFVGMVVGALVPIALKAAGIDLGEEATAELAQGLAVLIGGLIGMWAGRPDAPSDIEPVEPPSKTI